MIEAFKLLGRIVLEGGQAVIKELTGIGDKADKTGDNMQQMGEQTNTAGTKAAKSINEAGQAARNTSGAMDSTKNAAATMGETISNVGKRAYTSIDPIEKKLRKMARGLGEMDAATVPHLVRLANCIPSNARKCKDLIGTNYKIKLVGSN